VAKTLQQAVHIAVEDFGRVTHAVRRHCHVIAGQVQAKRKARSRAAAAARLQCAGRHQLMGERQMLSKTCILTCARLCNPPLLGGRSPALLSAPRAPALPGCSPTSLHAPWHNMEDCCCLAASLAIKVLMKAAGGQWWCRQAGLTEGCAAANSNDVGIAALRPEFCFQLPAQLQAANLLILLLRHLPTSQPTRPRPQSPTKVPPAADSTLQAAEKYTVLQHAHLVDFGAG
jgi:hypothetical protein